MGNTSNKGSFQFIVGTGIDTNEQILVKVYEPRNTTTAVDYTASQARNFKPNINEAKDLVGRLEPVDLARIPDPTVTLVRNVNNRILRIDSQPTTIKYRNIHIRNGRSGQGEFSFAVTTIDIGGDLCYTTGYEGKLLKYLRRGLMSSLKDQGQMQYNIEVEVSRRKKQKHETVQIDVWQKSKLNAREFEAMKGDIDEMVRHRQQKITKMQKQAADTRSRMQPSLQEAVDMNLVIFTSKNLLKQFPLEVEVMIVSQITKIVAKVLANVVEEGAKSTSAVTMVTKLIAESIAMVLADKKIYADVMKGLEKGGKSAADEVDANIVGTVANKAVEAAVMDEAKRATKMIIAKGAAKKIPIVGLVFGIGFGTWRAFHGDFVGAAGEVASGAASTIPGVGKFSGSLMHSPSVFFFIS